MEKQEPDYMSKHFSSFNNETKTALFRIKNPKTGEIFKTRGEPNQTYYYTQNFEFELETPKKDEYLISYKLNSHSFRSDEFDFSKSSENYVFAGCSYTFGVGVPLKDAWAYKVNKSLGGEKFFNLGVAGVSIQRSIINVLNYIKNFGNPKGIFILFPDLTRTVLFHEKMVLPINVDSPDKFTKVMISDLGVSKEFIDFNLKVLTYEKLYYEFCFSIITLEMLCKALNVPLWWGTWDDKLNNHILNHESDKFLNYVNILDKKELKRLLLEKEEEFKTQATTHPHWEEARDIVHPGAKYHSIYAEMFLRYLKRSK